MQPQNHPSAPSSSGSSTEPSAAESRNSLARSKSSTRTRTRIPPRAYAYSGCTPTVYSSGISASIPAPSRTDLTICASCNHAQFRTSIHSFGIVQNRAPQRGIARKSRSNTASSVSVLNSADFTMNEPPWDIRDRSFQFACDIVRFCRDLARDPSCRSIANQLLDAGTSVGANASEAKSAYSRAEFAYKNGLALKEARESVFWIRLMIACDLTHDPEVHRLLKEAGELVGIFNGIVRSSRRPLLRVTAPLLVLLLTSSF